MTIVNEVLAEVRQEYLEKWLQGDYTVEEKLGSMVEMAAYSFGKAGWFLVFYNVNTGGSPRRIDLLEKGTGKKWMIPFSSSGFDFSKCTTVPNDVLQIVKQVLSKSDVLQCADAYWTNSNFDQRLINRALGSN